jgi:phage-related protein
MRTKRPSNNALANVLNLGHTQRVKAIKFHPKALGFIRDQSTTIKQEVGEALRDVQKGISLGMPLSRSMPDVASGVHELRVKDETTAVRVFYFVKMADAIVVFHGFQKKTQKTPKHEMEVGSKRLREVLDGKV